VHLRKRVSLPRSDAYSTPGTSPDWRHLLDLILDALPDESIMGMSEDCPLIISDDSEDEEDEEPWSPFNLQDVLVCMYMALSPCITSLCVCVCVCKNKIK